MGTGYPSDKKIWAEVNKERFEKSKQRQWAAIDSKCKKCRQESVWCSPYWVCFACDLRWDSYWVDKWRKLDCETCSYPTICSQHK